MEINWENMQASKIDTGIKLPGKDPWWDNIIFRLFIFTFIYSLFFVDKSCSHHNE